MSGDIEHSNDVATAHSCKQVATIVEAAQVALL